MTQPNETVGQSKQTTAATKTSNQTTEQGAKKASKSGSPWLVVVVLVLVGVFVTSHLARRAGDTPRPVASADEESGPGVDTDSLIEPESESGATAALVITSDVRGADVYLNGKRVGMTPHKATPLTTGRYQVKVMKAGYETFEESVEVSSPSDTLRADLKPAAAAFWVETNVSGASVELDGEPRGSTPMALTELVPGTYELVVRAAGYKSHSETVEYAGGARDIRVDLVELSSTVVLNETVVVEHKHRIRGGCEGVLRANAEGIQFETEHKDAFSVSFSMLEQISFEKGQLSLKVQDGKSYSFVEPNDDEATLALFHEHVDEALVQMADSN